MRPVAALVYNLHKSLCGLQALPVSSYLEPTGKEVPTDAFLWDLLVGVIAGLVANLISRRFK